MTRAKWSNNGNSLLFTSYHISGFPDLIELDINSKKIRTIANFEGTNIGGDYSPNGKKIAMILSGKKEKSPDLYIYDILNGKFERALKTKAIESDPSWSPKGNKIVLVSDELGKPLLYIFDLKTKRKTLCFYYFQLKLILSN